jgi:hypothetical protein
MTTRLVLILLTAALMGAAVPAFAFDGNDNPGIDHKPATTPANTDNPRLSREEARAIGRDECDEFKQNFKENREAFGKCVAAVAKAIRDETVSPREACNAKELSHERDEGETRSDFKACILAGRRGENEVS